MKNASLRTNHPGKRWIHMVRRCSVTLPVLLIWLSVLLGACSGEPATGIQTRSVGGLPGFGLSRDDLVTHLLADNSGIDYSNVRLTCNDRSAGTFEDATMSITPTIGFESGVILSTGLIQAVKGDNTSDRITSDSDEADRAGDDHLTRSIGATTLDACALEFDFIPTGNAVTFRYVFASDEYPEFVNADYNDSFAFYVNDVNYARLPNGDPVSINTINKIQNSEFYSDNERDRATEPRATEMDGLTAPLGFTAPVNANLPNHMKLVIADVKDSLADSVVCIEGGSLRTDLLMEEETKFPWWWLHLAAAP